jgi:hypothetical protein
MLKDQIDEHIFSNKLLDDFQSGFRNKFSTTTALLKISDDIKKALDVKNITVLVLIDFSKAFDRLSYPLTLQKSHLSYGFSDRSCRLLHSFLTGRSQVVSFGDSLSDISLLLMGAQQGTLTGPRLFSLLLNDLPATIRHCKYHCFADDFQIYLSGPQNDINEIFSQVNQDLDSICSWASSNGLVINFKKTQAICFSAQKIPQFPSLIFDSNPVPLSVNITFYFP